MQDFWQQVVSVWNTTLWDISFSQLALAAGILLGFLLLRRLFSLIVINRIQALTKRTATELDDNFVEAVQAPLKFVFVIIGYYIATRFLEFPPSVGEINANIVVSLITFLMFWTAYRFIAPLSLVLDRVWTVFGGISADLKSMFVKSAKTLILLLGLAAILDEWGINVTGFLASLGLIGMAVALAARDFVGNLFGGLTIFLDKAFKKGDWIMTPKVEGTVDEIGLRATKIRTFADALESIPNGILANNEITNWSRMNSRRIKMTIGLEYRTTRVQVEKILARLRDYISSNDEINQDATQLIHLVAFNDSSIDILLYYFTKTTNWGEWMRVREENMLTFMGIVEQEGAAFAFPSRSLYMENADAMDRPVAP